MMSVQYLKDNNEFDKVSRYQVLRVIENGKQTYLETYNQVTVPVSEDDVYHVVRHSEVNRLDIISNTYYRTPNYFWAIALANDFIDPFIVNEGVMLRIPSTLTLNDFRYRILAR